MQELPEQALNEFVFYEKDVSNKKSRHQKKMQKVQKLKHDMNDPQMKKQRHTARRAQDKNKLKKQLQGMSEQQARKYLDEKKERKKQAKQRILKAIKEGQQIYIDIVYEKSMNEKQNKSLAIQTQLIMKAIKHIEDPPGIHLCSVGGLVEKQYEKMGYHYWTLESHKEDILDVAKLYNKKLVYLSPDAPDPLQTIQSDTAYVIGGLVDRTVKKNASLNRARQLNIEARHLPIREFMKGRICLNLDHVVKIICKFKQCKDWQQAFEYGAPKRWKRSQGQFGIRKIQKSDQSDNQEHNNNSSDEEQVSEQPELKQEKNNPQLKQCSKE